MKKPQMKGYKARSVRIEKNPKTYGKAQKGKEFGKRQQEGSLPKGSL